MLIGYSVSSLILALSFLQRRANLPPCPGAAGVAWFAAVGIANATAVMLLYAALALGSVTLVSPLVATYPLATLALTALLLRPARIDARLALGVLLTVAGVMVLIASPYFSHGHVLRCTVLARC